MLPLPFKHRQPDPDEGHQEFATEAIWTQFLPLTTTSQYILFWYAAETLPEACEEAYAEGSGGEGRERIYQSPPAFPAGQMLRERIALDDRKTDGQDFVYEPRWHPGTGVDEEAKLYQSYLLPIDEACRKIKNSVMEDVIRRAWAGVLRRMEVEDGRATTSS